MNPLEAVSMLVPASAGNGTGGNATGGSSTATAPPAPQRSASPLDNVVVVLYQPEDVVNVGSVVRAMTNFGLSRLRLVEPAAFDPYRIEGVAHQGGPVVAATRRYPSLEEALADCSLALATTGRPRHVNRDRLTPRGAAALVLQAARSNPGAPAALVFGRERDGLPNAAIDLCHGLVTIPTEPAHHSLNLSHAAAIIFYELWVAWLAGEAPSAGEVAGAQTNPAAGALAEAVSEAAARGRAVAVGARREAMFNALADLLEALFPRTAFGRRMSALARLRAILLRSAPSPDEVELLTHLFRHLARVARGRAGQGGEP